MSFELICYLNFGYPSIQEGLRYARMYRQAGCRALQIDLPSHDPYLEHQMIKDRMAACLRECADYEVYLEGIARLHRVMPDMKLVLMLYENIIEPIGLERLGAFCRENGIRDLTYVGSDPALRARLEAEGLQIACYVQFHLPEEEVEFARSAKGIVLLQARSAGVVRPGCESFEEALRFLRNRGISNPVYASVGIREPGDIVEVRRAGADGAFVGSTLIRTLPDEALLHSTMTAFIQAADGEATA